VICRIVSVAALVATGGPAIVAAQLWLFGGSFNQVRDHPLEWLARSAFIGLLFLAFPLLLGPPVRLVGRRLSQWPRWKAGAAVSVFAFCAGSLALILVASVLSFTRGYHFNNRIPFEKMALVTGLIASGVGLVTSTHGRMRAERDAAAARAESAALTAQIRPHFLFNTLNAISAQVKVDPDSAQENLGRLADMFRYTMNHSQRDFVPLSEEVALAREYLMLEKARFGSRLSFVLPEIDLKAKLPGLTLQPLVENAVRHGIAKRGEGGCVSVSFEHANGNSVLKVRNPTAAGGAVPEDRLFEKGHALWILRQRVPSLKIRQEPPGTFEVELTIIS